MRGCSGLSGAELSAAAVLVGLGNSWGGEKLLNKQLIHTPAQQYVAEDILLAIKCFKPAAFCAMDLE
jgi:hypothetical protein